MLSSIEIVSAVEPYRGTRLSCLDMTAGQRGADKVLEHSELKLKDESISELGKQSSPDKNSIRAAPQRVLSLRRRVHAVPSARAALFTLEAKPRTCTLRSRFGYSCTALCAGVRGSALGSVHRHRTTCGYCTALSRTAVLYRVVQSYLTTTEYRPVTPTSQLL